jgi:hypothetical protein
VALPAASRRENALMKYRFTDEFLIVVGHGQIKASVYPWRSVDGRRHDAIVPIMTVPRTSHL